MNPSLRPITSLLRIGVRQSERLVRALAGAANGILAPARSLRGAAKPDMDDRTLAAKVQTELFRPRGTPKGDVDIDVVEGVVYLRGQVKRPAQITDLEARARAIPEVRGVENLLHLPKTPSPTRADSPRSAQKTPRSPKPAPRKRTAATRTRTTAEIPKAPPTPRTSEAAGASAGTAEDPVVGGGATARTGTTRAAEPATTRARTAAKRAGTTRPAASAPEAAPALPSAIETTPPEPPPAPEQSGPGAAPGAGGGSEQA